MGAQYFQKVDRLTILVGLLMSAVFYFWKGSGPAVSALIGCSLGMLNFVAQRYVTARLIQRTVRAEQGGPPVWLLFIGKYIGLGVALVLIFGIRRIDVIGFTAGFFSYIVAVVAVGGLPSSAAPAEPVSEDTASDSRVD